MTTRPGAKPSNTRAYKFGVLKVLSGEATVMRELELQHELWNQLCMEDGKARKAFGSWLVQKDPDIGPLETEIGLLKATLAEASDSSSTDSEVQTARATKLGAMFTIVTQLRRAVVADNKAEAVAIQHAEKRSFRNVGSQSGLWWCHMEDVLARFETARWAAIKTGESLWPRRFSGSGTLKARLTSGSQSLRINDLVEGSTRLVHIRRADESERGPRLKAEKADGGTRAVVTILVSANHGDDQRSASFLVTLHRPVPATARVKEVTLTRRAVAASMTSAKWSVSIVVEEGAVAPAKLSDGESRVEVGVARPTLNGEARLVVATCIGPTGEIEAALDGRWATGVSEALRLRLEKSESIAEVLRWLSGLLHPDLASSSNEGVERLRRLLSGQVSLRDLHAVSVQLVPSPDGLNATDIALLVGKVKHLIDLAEKADHISKKADRYRISVFRVFAAAVVSQRKAVVVDRVDSANSGASDARQVANPSPSLLVRFVQEACRREGLPFRVQTRVGTPTNSAASAGAGEATPR
jgi:hypothetical protein